MIYYIIFILLALAVSSYLHYLDIVKYTTEITKLNAKIAEQAKIIKYFQDAEDWRREKSHYEEIKFK